jgi:hypothetical protein
MRQSVHIQIWQEMFNANQENKCPGSGQALSLGFLNSQAQLRLTPGPSLSRAELSSNGPGLSGPQAGHESEARLSTSLELPMHSFGPFRAAPPNFQQTL